MSRASRPRRCGRERHLWGAAVLAIVAPLLFLLCATLWRMPYSISETVAIFFDVQQNSPLTFFAPQGAYYRPLFYVAVSAIWNNARTIEGALLGIKLLHIVPVTALVSLLIWHLRPKTALDGAATLVAVSVLVGSPGLLGNLELPLSYTIVGMPLALMAWHLMERDYRRWHGAAIVALVLVAVGFKEQGLVLAPLVVVAWWTGAPGVRRGSVAAVVAIAVGYVAFRLVTRDNGQMFEQNVGLGFSMLDTDEAEARFGAFPLWIYAYSGASTVANVLFSEPTEGVFRIVRDLTENRLRSWEILNALSSLGLTGLVAWWGVGAVRRARHDGWSPESRASVAAVVATLACGVLSFNYSRDRLGGMAVPFYALATFFAVRAAAGRALQRSAAAWITTGLVLLLLAGAWQIRATYTLEYTRQRAVNNRREWLTSVQRRRVEFADRPAYLSILERLAPQGTAPNALARTRYPRWFYVLLGE